MPYTCIDCGNISNYNRCSECGIYQRYRKWITCKYCGHRTHPDKAEFLQDPIACQSCQQCIVIGCVKLASDADWYHCEIHKKCYIIGCNDCVIEKSNNLYCERHTCSKPRCDKKTLYDLSLCQRHAAYKCSLLTCCGTPTRVQMSLPQRKAISILPMCIICTYRVVLPGLEVCAADYSAEYPYDPWKSLCEIFNVSIEDKPTFISECSVHKVCLYINCYHNINTFENYCWLHKCPQCFKSILCKHNRTVYIQKYLRNGYLAAVPYDISYSTWLFLEHK